MAKKFNRSKEDEDKMSEEFMALLAQVKPVIGDPRCIDIMNRCKMAAQYHKLFLRNVGTKNERYYRTRRWNHQRDSIIVLRAYVHSLKTKS